MSETHTKPTESVRNGLSLFGEKDDQKKHQHRSKRDYEKEIEDLTKDLTNSKLQLEANHAAYMQAIRKMEHYQKLTSELFTLLKKSDTERNKHNHVNECKNGRASTDELESMMKEMDDQLGNAKFREQLSQLLSELKATQRMLLTKEIELVAAKDSELKALTKTEEMEIAFNAEKEKKEQLLQQLEELKLKKQIENYTDKGLKERKSMDQTVYTEALETNLSQLKQELVIANGLNNNIGSLTGEMNKIKEKYNEAQVQIALLTSQLRKGEAAEESNNGNNNDHITIPLKEYEYLIRKVEKANEAQASMVEVGSQSEPALLKMELEAATAKIGELRARAQQALSRAEFAEKAKADLEDKLKRHRETRQRRRAAMAALQEISTPKQSTPSSSSEVKPQEYVPLSKILNLKI